MDEKRKKDLDRLINNEIERGHFPGFLIGLKTKEKEEVFSYGMADPSSCMKMKRDTIFRLYSMSKPVCAVAVWILIERGALSLDDRLGDIMDEFRDMVRYEGDRLVPVQHPITIRELLNMTAGFTYDDDDNAGRKTGRLFDRIHQAEDEGQDLSTRDVMKMLAEQPLANEPGMCWRYGLCADVLGAVIEVVSGRKLSDFYREEIFEPLGMKDSGFYVPEDKQYRFSPLFSCEDNHGKCKLIYDREHHLGLDNFLSPPSFESAGAGLVSTYDDYMKFAWMLACRGELNGTRIIQKETVNIFCENQLTESQTEGIYFDYLKGYGYGNLMRVCLEGKKAHIPGIRQAFGWDGWCGPYMTVDSKEQKALIFFLQIAGYTNWKLNADILRLFI